MATSRTGTASHKHFRREVIRNAINQGVTNCPCPHGKHHPRGVCNNPLDYNTPRTPNSAEADHILMHSQGGTDNPTNGRVICRHCNQARCGQTTKNTPVTPTAVTTTTLINW